MSTSIEPAVTVDRPVAAPPDQEEVAARGYWELIWIRFRRDRLAVISAAFIVFLIFAAYGGAPIAAHILGHGPNTQFPYGVDQFSDVPVGPWTHVSTAPFFYPGAAHKYPTTLLILGADSGLGRDMFLRLLYGAQTSLEVAFFATIGSVGIGILLGLMAGYFRGWIDTLISRLVEITMVFPFIFFVIALRIVAGPQLDNVTFGFLPQGVFTLALLFSIFGWFYPCRIMRGVVFSLREKEFVEAARMTGASDWRIMRSHLLPWLVAPITVYSSLIFATNVLAEAGLSFLGLGINQPTASWGNLLAAAPDYLLSQPWLMVWPGLAIIFTTIAFNLLGDGLRDAFDPRARI